LPKCEVPENSRYENEIETFWWDARVHIYSRYNNLTVAAEANASTVISFRLAS